MSIEALTEISRYYGANPDYVIAGGGNTSYKEMSGTDTDILYIKGSGTALAEAESGTFVKMDRKALGRIWEKKYPTESALREKEVLADLMAARMAGEEQKRPSVETMLHDLLPFRFVVHTHPALVNGITCSREGEAAVRELFPEKDPKSGAIWIPSTNPGYILSLRVKTALNEFIARNNRPAAVIFLQNHGVFVGAGSIEEIKDIYRDIMGRIEGRIQRQPDFSGENSQVPWEYLSAIEGITSCKAAFLQNKEISNLVKDRSSFNPVSSAFTPDHIVYAGSDPLFTGAQTEDNGMADWKRHIEKTGRPPKIAALQGLGVFGLGPTVKAAGLALELFRDAVRIAVYSESFGGPLFMREDQIDFINNWEVEQFRSRVSAK